MLRVQDKPEEGDFQITCLLPAPSPDSRTQGQGRGRGSSWRGVELRGEGSKFQELAGMISFWSFAL